MKRFLPLVAIVALLPVLALADTNSGTPENTGIVPGQVLVRFRQDASSTIEGLTAKGADAVYNETLNVWRLDVGSEEAAEVIIERLEGDPAVGLVQPQYRYVPATTPDDPIYRARQQVHFDTINLQEAWDLGTPPNEVVVAVLDSGVDVTHPELADRIWTNPGETVNGLDDDGNGCVDDVTGCNLLAVPPNGDVTDREGHGTFGAGLIAAESNNGAGIAGVAENAIIMPVRTLALNDPNAGTTEQFAGAIRYAAEMGADVINMSLKLGRIGEECPVEPIIEEVLAEVIQQYGVTIIAAAGNDRLRCVGYPASSELTIAVGGSGPPEDTDTHADFSQWGPEIDVAAPAVDIYSTCPLSAPEAGYFCSERFAGTTPDFPYGFGDGTSFATPIVSGVVALLLGHEPGLTPDEVRKRLRETARPVPDEDRLNWAGAGIVDAGGALGAGSAFSSLDFSGGDLDSLALAVAVGTECRAEIWQSPATSAHATSSTAGVGQCAAFWPPTPDRPWSLAAQASGRKAVTVNSWSVMSAGVACAAPGAPIIVAPGATARLDIDCVADAWVANDLPSTPRNVPQTLPRTYQQDIRLATTTGDPPLSCTFPPVINRSVWYRIPGGGQPAGIAVDTFGTGFNTLVAAYRVDDSDLTEVACNRGALGSFSRIVLQTDGTSDYLVGAGAYGGSPATTLHLNFSDAHIPANDDSGSPVDLEVGAGVHAQPARSAWHAPDDPQLSCSLDAGSTLWFRVVAAASGQLTVDSAGSTYDTVLGVFQQTSGGPTEVACGDDGGLNIRQARATWAVEAGREYLVMVGSFQRNPAGALRIAVTD